MCSIVFEIVDGFLDSSNHWCKSIHIASPFCGFSHLYGNADDWSFSKEDQVKAIHSFLLLLAMRLASSSLTSLAQSGN